MKIKCRNCGTEFESNFCPNCGCPHDNNPNVNQFTNMNATPFVNPNVEVPNDIETSKNKSVELIINIVRWVAIAFLVLIFLGSLIVKGWASAFLAFIAILVISPLNKLIPIKIPRVVYGIAALVLFFVALGLYPTQSATEKDNEQASTEAVTEVKIDRKTQKKIDKIDKYIADGKYEKAYKKLSESDLPVNERTRLYARYYTAQGEYGLAENVLYTYCSGLDPLSDNEVDPLYAQLVDLYDKVPEKQEEIDLFQHAVHVSKVGYEEGHDWIDAGCTTKRTCKICGEETGEPLGHDWQEATCTEAKKCLRCDEREGAPLGHEIEDWTVTKEPTCSEEGLEIGVCTRCGEEVEQNVAKTEHTAGKWEITKETSSASVPGEKSLLCKVCGEVMETEPYTITKEEELKIYKRSFESVSYEELSRYPDKYKGKRVKVTVKIVDEMEEGIILYTPYKAKMGGKDIALSDGREVKEPKLLKGDTVTIYGEGDGTETVKTKRQGLLWDKTIDKTEIPMVKILYVEF